VVVESFLTASLQTTEDPNVPIIMVGAGTGLAPFRGFLQERECQLKQRGSVGRTKLYFGCMDRTKDYIYANELHRWRDMGLLELDTAFSHENPNQLVFVQHLLVRDSEIIWDLIHNKKASFYVCGFVHIIVQYLKTNSKYKTVPNLWVMAFTKRLLKLLKRKAV